MRYQLSGFTVNLTLLPLEHRLLLFQLSRPLSLMLFSRLLFFRLDLLQRFLFLKVFSLRLLLLEYHSLFLGYLNLFLLLLFSLV